jgi:hypothetical protein
MPKNFGTLLCGTTNTCRPSAAPPTRRMTTVPNESMLNAAVRLRLQRRGQLARHTPLLLGKIRKLPGCRSPYRALDARTHHVRSRFHAMDVIGQGIQRLAKKMHPAEPRICMGSQETVVTY